MAIRAKKWAVSAFAAVWLCLFLAVGHAFAAFTLPTPPSAPLPYALNASFYRTDGDAARLLPGSGQPGTVFLAVSALPTEADSALYASKSQASGKVTEIRVLADGQSMDAPVVFPRGVPKPDPLRPGEATRMFPDGFTALVPLPESALAAGGLNVLLTGLACSPVNCTPVSLAMDLPVPEAGTLASLPDAAEAPWWEPLLSGVAEAMPSLSGTAGGERAGVTDTPAGAFIGKITPVPFNPGLEVASMGKAIVFGFLAGIILNLMPCVLPVLGIKLAALLGHGTTPEGIRRFRRHQVLFACGILAWFTVMAGLFHFLDLAWGQIFQSPVVVFVLAVVLLMLALNMFGVFSLPLIELRAGNTKNPDIRAFAEGFGATLLATPCGGPLLGGVLSWALLQPFGVLALTLESVGLGMAFPYLLLAAFPALAKRLPRPGEWMLTMEHFLGFLLLGTVAYLVSFLPLGILPRVVAALVLAAFGCWLWQKRAPARVLGVLCILTACVWPFYPQPPVNIWADYSHAGFGEMLGKRPILVDFTADWCPTCKVVEATALSDDTLMAWEKEYNLALFRVDMTRQNPQGEALLRAVGSVSIPVIAVFGTGDDAYSPLVLRDVVTRGQIEAALEWVAGK